MDDLLHHFRVHRFADDLVHASLQPHLYEFVLHMPSHPKYKGLLVLWNSLLFEELSDQAHCLDAVHHRHLEVAEDHSVAYSSRVALFHEVQHFLARDAQVQSVLHIKPCRLDDQLH